MRAITFNPNSWHAKLVTQVTNEWPSQNLCGYIGQLTRVMVVMAVVLAGVGLIAVAVTHLLVFLFVALWVDGMTFETTFRAFTAMADQPEVTWLSGTAIFSLVAWIVCGVILACVTIILLVHYGCIGILKTNDVLRDRITFQDVFDAIRGKVCVRIEWRDNETDR